MEIAYAELDVAVERALFDVRARVEIRAAADVERAAEPWNGRKLEPARPRFEIDHAVAPGVERDVEREARLLEQHATDEALGSVTPSHRQRRHREFAEHGRLDLGIDGQHRPLFRARVVERKHQIELGRRRTGNQAAHVHPAGIHVNRRAQAARELDRAGTQNHAPPDLEPRAGDEVR